MQKWAYSYVTPKGVFMSWLTASNRNEAIGRLHALVMERGHGLVLGYVIYPMETFLASEE